MQPIKILTCDMEFNIDIVLVYRLHLDICLDKPFFLRVYNVIIKHFKLIFQAKLLGG